LPADNLQLSTAHLQTNKNNVVIYKSGKGRERESKKITTKLTLSFFAPIVEQEEFVFSPT
jgi:hypothetical protein